MAQKLWPLQPFKDRCVWGENCQTSGLKNLGNKSVWSQTLPTNSTHFEYKFRRPSHQESGIQKTSMQAFTALCGTKIVAATAI